MSYLIQGTNAVVEAAAVLKDAIHKVLQRRREVVIALPGGRSIVPLLESLRGADLPWERMHFFYG